MRLHSVEQSEGAIGNGEMDGVTCRCAYLKDVIVIGVIILTYGKLSNAKEVSFT